MNEVTTLRGLSLTTSRLEEQYRFYTAVWGLTPVPGTTAGAARYLRGRGAEPWVLGLENGSDERLACLRLGAPSKAAVHAIHARILVGGGRPLSGPAPLPGPGGYYGFLFEDPDGRSVEISSAAPWAPSDAGNRPTPLRMSHVVLNSLDARRTVAFYVEALGFRISDWYERDAIVFLRCNQDHHCVGIAQGTNTKLNHMAFLVEDEAAVLAASEMAKARGAVPLWGPGRHGPGGNVFSYFRDPAQFVCEYTAELIQIAQDEPWTAKEWKRTPGNANVWGTGGPTREAIRLMGGE